MYRYKDSQLSGFQDSPSSISAMNIIMAGNELTTAHLCIYSDGKDCILGHALSMSVPAIFTLGGVLSKQLLGEVETDLLWNRIGAKK